MNDMPMSTSVPMDSQLSDECKKQLDKLLAEKPIQEIRQIGDYCFSKASEMSSKLEKNITMQDFEKMMKDEGSKEESYE